MQHLPSICEPMSKHLPVKHYYFPNYQAYTVQNTSIKSIISKGPSIKNVCQKTTNFEFFNPCTQKCVDLSPRNTISPKN